MTPYVRDSILATAALKRFGQCELMHIGVDTGGTFTDLLLWDGRRLRAHKVPSTPQDFSEGVLRGIAEILDEPHTGAFDVTLSATVATNALLERKGARTALITTRGFRDVLEIGRQTRPSLYDLLADRPPPLVPRSLRLEVTERIDAGKQVVRPLEVGEVEDVLDRLAEKNVESVAICLLFSFLHPQHERLIARAARRRGLTVSVSSELLAEFREYERTSTTVVNAYVAPIMQGYIRRIDRSLRTMGVRRWRIVQSNGGSLSPKSAGEQAVHTLLSGPAAGVIGALSVARLALAGRRGEAAKVITFDMGGTSTDVSLIAGACAAGSTAGTAGSSRSADAGAGAGAVTTEGSVAGCPVRVPMLDIHTVGAGGGSIAHLDAGGALHVGPRSAGARPGPACYGVGDDVTVTDANLILGRIEPDRFLGGKIKLDAPRAEKAMRRLARKLGTSTPAAARSIIRIVGANMERALRLISIERGHDPREFTLVSFGGAGGLHACELAAALHIPRVLIPFNPGVLSAWGGLVCDVVKDYSRTVMLSGGADPQPRIRRVVRELEGQARREMGREAPRGAKLVLSRSLDLRYAGQAFELNVPHAGKLRAAVERFHADHARRYGHSDMNAVVEVVTVRVRATGTMRKPAPQAIPRGAADARRAICAKRSRMTLYDREKLRAGNRLTGPALVVEPFATTWIPKEWRGTIDRWGNVLLEYRKTR